MDIENKKEAARKKSLGELGELFALKALVDKKFDRIRNLNDKLMNEAFADIECEKGIIGQIWELNKRHYFDFEYYSNKDKIKTVPKQPERI